MVETQPANRPKTKPSRPLKPFNKDQYKSNGPKDTDLQGFKKTVKNDPAPGHSELRPGRMQTATPIFNQEYYEAFDVCFVWPKKFKEKEENKTMTAKQSEKIIMQILCARNDSDYPYNDPRALHKCYGLSPKEVQRSYTNGELRELFMKQTIAVINRIGCFTATSESHDKGRILIRAKMEEEACKRHADMKNYPLQMDYNVTSFEQFKQDPTFTGPFVPFERCVERTTRDGSAMDKIGHVWQRYDRISRPFNHDFSRGDEELSIFRDIDRVRILMDVLNEYINVTMMEDKKYINSAFILHQPATLEALKNSWAKFRLCWSTGQPLDMIRDYFGEKVALYYAWMSLYCWMLAVPALAGLILYVSELIFDNNMEYRAGGLNYMRVLFCAIVTAWSTWFYQLWRRRESVLRLRWGSEVVTGNLTSPAKSPYFKPECNIIDPIHPNGRVVPSISPAKHFTRKVIAAIVAVSITCLAACVVNDEAVDAFLRMFGVIDSESQKMTWEHLIGADQPTSADFGSGLAYFWFLAYMPLILLVKVINFFWDRVLIQRISKFENNPFFEQYYKSVTMYSFIFKFANHLIPLMYLAFLKEYFGELCDDTDDGRCIKATRKMLQGFILAGMTGNFMEIGMPFFKNWMKQRKAKKAEIKPAFYEIQADTKPYNTRSQIKDFQEVMLEYCFVSLFGVVFPLMPLLNLIVTMVEIRSDAYKLTHVYRRTWPDPAPDGVGSWNTIQRSITFGCVITNVLLSGLVTIGYHRSLIFKLAFTLILLLLVLAMKEFLEYRYPVTSKKYRTQKARSHVVHFEAIWGTKNMETKSTPMGF